MTTQIHMKHTLLTFDTDTLQGKIRNTLMGQEYGYTHVVGSTEQDMAVSLPINAVAHLTKSPEQVLTDVKAVCQMLEVSLKKYVVFEVTESLASSAS